MRTEFVLKFLSKIVFCLGLYQFFWIAWEVAYHPPMELFIANTMADWILFIGYTVLSVIIDVAATNPELRWYFTHLEKGKKGARPRPEGKLNLKNGKVVTETIDLANEDEAVKLLLKRYPVLTEVLNDPETRKKMLKTKEEKPEKLPLI